MKRQHAVCPECKGVSQAKNCWACLGTGLSNPRLAEIPECAEQGCEFHAYKNSEHCRVHDSEIRMFGHTRLEIERTAKTYGGSMATGEYSQMGRNLKHAANGMGYVLAKRLMQKRAICRTNGCTAKVHYEGNCCYTCFMAQPAQIAGRRELNEAIENLNRRK